MPTLKHPPLPHHFLMVILQHLTAANANAAVFVNMPTFAKIK